MAKYRVLWEIDIEAESHEAAARIARDHQTRADSIANVFDVYRGNEPFKRIDLQELDG